MIDFVYLLPAQADPNLHLRKAIEDESLHCSFQFRFHRIESLDLASLGNRVVFFGSLYACYRHIDLYGLCAILRKKRQCRLAYWSCEDPHENDHSTQFKRLFDIVFSNDLQCLKDYDPTPCQYMPMASSSSSSLLERAAAPWPESSHDPDVKEKIFDVFFCGVAYKNRIETLEKCLPALLPYRSLLVGPGWEIFSDHHSDLVVLDRLGYDQVLSHYRRDRVLLSISRHFSLGDQRNRPGLSPTPRAFELAALGSCQIAAEPFDPEHACFTEAEIPRFSDSDSLAAHLSYFLDPLAGSERRRTTGDQAKRRALDCHLYRYRLDMIGDWARTA